MIKSVWVIRTAFLMPMRLPTFLFVLDNLHPRIGFGNRLQVFEGIIRGTIVNEHDLQFVARIVEVLERIRCLQNMRAFVVHGHDNGNSRPHQRVFAKTLQGPLVGNAQR